MKLVHNILSTCGRPWVVQAQASYTEYYLFNSAANMKAYSYDRTDFAYYGYNASNTRTYKLSMLNQNQWVNGQPEPLNLQLQSAMFYPNAYINFNQNGEYTKHYYNGTERIASRLGDNTPVVATDGNERLLTRSGHVGEQFQSDIRYLITEEIPVDMQGTMAITSLQPANATSNIFYYHTNHLGSTAFVTDQNQNVTQGFLYAPFGEITTEYNSTFGNDIIPKYSFNAKELDEETGMYYYEARYYKPPVFTSRDAMMDQKPWLSPYHYCSNNPVGRVDPSGMMDDWVEKADGTIYWDENATSPSTTKEGERYLGKKGYDVNTLYLPDGTTKERMHYLKSVDVTANATEHEKAMYYKHKLGIHEGGFSIHPEGITNIIKGFSIDGTLAYGPVGLTFDFGIIRDNKSGFSGFFSIGYAMGWEKSLGINAIVIPSSTFKKEDFSGFSWNINASLKRFGFSLTGDIQRGENRDRYSDYYLGGKIGFGAGLGASFSITYTFLFN